MFNRKLSIFILLLLSLSNQANAFNLHIIGENHQSPECKTNRRAYVQDALDKKLHLGFEGFMLDDFIFNQDIAKHFPGGSFEMDEKTQVYGVEEKQLYALAGLYMNQSLMEIAKRLYLQGIKTQQGRIFQAVSQFMDLIRKFPEIAQLYYGKDKVPQDMLKNLKANLDLMFTDNGLNIPEIEKFEQSMLKVCKDYRQLLTDKKLYPIDETKLPEAGVLAAREGLTSTVAAETYYYNYMLRDEVMANSISSLIEKLRTAGAADFYIITGRKHAGSIEKKMNAKQINDLNVSVSDLCY